MNKPVEIMRHEDSMDMHICWSLHNKCNYSCSYCPDYNRSGSYTWLTKELVFKTVDQIYEHYIADRGLKQAQISFTGGEPPLWKDFIEACHYINNKGFSIGMTSNGSLGLSKWKNIAGLLDWLSLSYHPQFVDDDHFFELLSYLHDRPNIFLPAVRFMMHPERKYWDKCISFAEKIKASLPNWAIEYVEIQNDFGENITRADYDIVQKEFLKTHGYFEQQSRKDLIKPPKHAHYQFVRYDNGQKEQLRTNELINKKLVNFYDWECDIGLESLFIDYAGNIYRAGCQVGGKIGNVQQEGPIIFPTDPVRCQKEICSCGTNVMVSKRKIQT